MKKVKSGGSHPVAIKILVVFVVLSAFLNFLPKPQNHVGENPLMKEDGALPILVAHRGGDGEFPGNTLEAFYNAYTVDNRVIMETDINITKDGVLILCHETSLNKRTNVGGAISSWNYSDLLEQKVNFGYHSGKLFKDENGKEVKPSDLEGKPEGLENRDSEIYLVTSLEDLMVTFPNNIISIEIKQSGEIGMKALKEALRLIEKYDAWDRIILASFHDDIYAEYCRLDKSGEVPENFLYSPSMGGVVKYYLLYLFGLDIFFYDGISVLQLPTSKYGFSFVTENLMNNARTHNIPIHYWTVNDEEEMRWLIKCGADAIETDYPHKYKAVVDELNN